MGMNDERRQEAEAAAVVRGGFDQDASRGLAGDGVHGTDRARGQAPGDEHRQKLVRTVGREDDRDTAARGDKAPGGTHDVVDRAGEFLPRERPLCVGRHAGRPLRKGRIRDNQVERSGKEPARRRVPEISGHERDAIGDPVQERVPPRQRDERRLDVQTDGGRGDSGVGKRQRDHARAAAQIEHLLASPLPPARRRPPGNEVGEEQGVVRHARAAPRLEKPQPSAQNRVERLAGARPQSIRREGGDRVHNLPYITTYRSSDGSSGLMTRPLAIFG